MAFRFVVLACFAAVASAGVISTGPVSYAAAPAYHQVAYNAAPAYHTAYAAPIAKVVAPIAKVAVEDYDHNPQYSFAYDVQDGLTGDSKAQHETRNGDVVSGAYSVVDPDGIKRTVEYTSDPHNGFNAVVHREPVGVKVAAVAKVATPVAYAAAPVVHKVAAPVAYAAAPAYHGAPAYHAAPVAYQSAPVAYQSAPVAYQSAPVAYQSAPVAYQSAPIYHHH